MAKIMYAKELVEQKIDQLRYQVQLLTKKPKLKVILVGQNRSSLAYIANKERKAKLVGADFELIQLEETINESSFLQSIKDHTSDEYCTGLIIQLPLPKQLSHLDLTNLIPAEKDVDGFSWENIKELYYRREDELNLIPCTPKGIVDLLRFFNISIESKRVVIVGRSFIVGKPLSLLMESLNATVTICHSRTKDLKEQTRKADILISAMGQPRFITQDFLSPNKDQVLVDVGITSVHGQWQGDMDFDNCKDHCAYITPVPGGIGPMTVISLIDNLIIAAKRQGY